MVHNLSNTNSIFSSFLSEIRDVSIQKDAMRFRRNMERISEIMAYEVSKTLEFEATDVTTPLGLAKVHTIKEQPFKSWFIHASRIIKLL